jgi:hypothetical protein
VQNADPQDARAAALEHGGEQLELAGLGHGNRSAAE